MDYFLSFSLFFFFFFFSFSLYFLFLSVFYFLFVFQGIVREFRGRTIHNSFAGWGAVFFRAKT